MNSNATRSNALTPSPIRRWLREPLLHFIMAGFALFVIYGGLHGGSAKTDPRRIEITADDVNRIESSWLAQWQRPPTADETRGLVNDQVKEEILYREALALGLDKNDTIIKRRLAQKMDFLDDDAALREPAPGEVEAWFARNPQLFATAPLVTFHHLYFASDKRGASAKIDAQKTLAKLAGKDAQGGDPFMFQAAYTEQTPDQVVRTFGSKFASSLLLAKPGAWRGPIESGYGWHLVWIDASTPSQLPAFETVAQQAKVDWLSEQREKTKRAAFEALKSHYEIVVAQPSPAMEKVAASAVKP
ncbi:MAG: peptidyl-prolyl cis-trans isomerase, partial [Bryobacteraceae bacterium]